MEEKFLELENVTVRSGAKILLDDICLTVHRDEQWVITGSSGSGKTLLANTIAGKNFHAGKVKYYFETGKNNKAIIIVEQQHRFKNLFNTSDLYYQQRFNSYDSEQTITVQQELQEHFTGNHFLQSTWIDELDIRKLLDEPLVQLSNGENKRVQLAIALIENPELLILDNPFTGLDIEGRKILSQIIQTITKKNIHVLLITSHKEIPGSITHIAYLGNGKLLFGGTKEKFQLHEISDGKLQLNADFIDRLKPSYVEDFNIIIRMVNVSVRYGNKLILDKINWEVKKGERWSLSGPNGAGKSTLLSLVTADNPQAYANEIYLFDKRRGTGESIWDIKQKIGFVSPELHLYFDFSATCFEVVASGLFDTVGLFRQLDERQQQKVLLWLKLFQLENLSSKRLSQISVSEQRKTLLARALIKTPPLLILDEPCQGLDDAQTEHFKNLVDEICASFNTTLVYVSHYQHQIPYCVDRFLHLKNGVVAGPENLH
ncbi:MAG TPA: ATP-binding cassette domain-containing protein [Puia sp.]|nr:ATP-binding cassette domain-containing protein [Puia sp.]